ACRPLTTSGPATPSGICAAPTGFSTLPRISSLGIEHAPTWLSQHPVFSSTHARRRATCSAAYPCPFILGTMPSGSAPAAGSDVRAVDMKDDSTDLGSGSLAGAAAGHDGSTENYSVIEPPRP